MRTRDYAPRAFPALHRNLPPSLASYSGRRVRMEMSNAQSDSAETEPRIVVATAKSGSEEKTVADPTVSAF